MTRGYVAFPKSRQFVIKTSGNTDWVSVQLVFVAIYMKIHNNPWSRTKKQLEKIAKIISLDPLLLARLSEPDRIVEVSLPLQKDNGEVASITGYRVQHNNLL